MSHTPAPLVASNRNALRAWCIYRVTADGQLQTGAAIGEACCQEDAQLWAAAPRLLELCKQARELYDDLSLGSLGFAAKYGPDREPPTEEDCLAFREALDAVIAEAEKKS